MHLINEFQKSLLLMATTAIGAALLSGRIVAEQPDRAGDRLSPTEFVEPPLNARPGGFWDWLNGSISKEQITRDLEAMKAGGMRGCEIWGVAACADPDGRVPAGPAFLGPESTQLIVHAIREADRLGLELGIVASSGWNAGGSWVTPEQRLLILDTWKRSGLPGTEFASMVGISHLTLYIWIRERGTCWAHGQGQGAWEGEPPS